MLLSQKNDGATMNLFQQTFNIKTHGRGTIEITDNITHILSETGIKKGLCHIFLSHTSASLIFCENADVTVRKDLETFMAKLVPENNQNYSHTAEGSDDMPAHLRTILTQNSLTVPIFNHTLGLGTWQGIYLWEHRREPHERNITITIIG